MEEGQTEEKEEGVDSWEKRQEWDSEMETERWTSHDAAAEKDRPEMERGERKEEKQETAEERGQMDEAAMAADQAEESRTREEKEKGVHKGGKRVNLEDWLRRFKLRQREQQQQGDMEEYQERDRLLEQRQERREEWSERQEMGQDERERVRWEIGQGKGMRKCKRP